ncbi:hypothetical protein Tco_0491487 [Tanacetum coccineum]
MCQQIFLSDVSADTSVGTYGLRCQEGYDETEYLLSLEVYLMTWLLVALVDDKLAQCESDSAWGLHHVRLHSYTSSRNAQRQHLNTSPFSLAPSGKACIFEVLRGLFLWVLYNMPSNMSFSLSCAYTSCLGPVLPILPGAFYDGSS